MPGDLGDGVHDLSGPRDDTLFLVGVCDRGRSIDRGSDRIVADLIGTVIEQIVYCAGIALLLSGISGRAEYSVPPLDVHLVVDLVGGTLARGSPVHPARKVCIGERGAGRRKHVGQEHARIISVTRIPGARDQTERQSRIVARYGVIKPGERTRILQGIHAACGVCYLGDDVVIDPGCIDKIAEHVQRGHPVFVGHEAVFLFQSLVQLCDDAVILRTDCHLADGLHGKLLISGGQHLTPARIEERINGDQANLIGGPLSDDASYLRDKLFCHGEIGSMELLAICLPLGTEISEHTYGCFDLAVDPYGYLPGLPALVSQHHVEQLLESVIEIDELRPVIACVLGDDPHGFVPGLALEVLRPTFDHVLAVLRTEGTLEVPCERSIAIRLKKLRLIHLTGQLHAILVGRVVGEDCLLVCLVQFCVLIPEHTLENLEVFAVLDLRVPDLVPKASHRAVCERCVKQAGDRRGDVASALNLPHADVNEHLVHRFRYAQARLGHSGLKVTERVVDRLEQLRLSLQDEPAILAETDVRCSLVVFRICGVQHVGGSLSVRSNTTEIALGRHASTLIGLSQDSGDHVDHLPDDLVCTPDIGRSCIHGTGEAGGSICLHLADDLRYSGARVRTGEQLTTVGEIVLDGGVDLVKEVRLIGILAGGDFIGPPVSIRDCIDAGVRTDGLIDSLSEDAPNVILG